MRKALALAMVVEKVAILALVAKTAVGRAPLLFRDLYREILVSTVGCNHLRTGGHACRAQLAGRPNVAA
jgi:hypothetical protein